MTLSKINRSSLQSVSQAVSNAYSILLYISYIHILYFFFSESLRKINEYQVYIDFKLSLVQIDQEEIKVAIKQKLELADKLEKKIQTNYQLLLFTVNSLLSFVVFLFWDYVAY